MDWDSTLPIGYRAALPTPGSPFLSLSPFHTYICAACLCDMSQADFEGWNPSSYTRETRWDLEGMRWMEILFLIHFLVPSPLFHLLPLSFQFSHQNSFFFPVFSFFASCLLSFLSLQPPLLCAFLFCSRKCYLSAPFKDWKPRNLNYYSCISLFYFRTILQGECGSNVGRNRGKESPSIGYHEFP